MENYDNHIKILLEMCEHELPQSKRKKNKIIDTISRLKYCFKWEWKRRGNFDYWALVSDHQNQPQLPNFININPDFEYTWNDKPLYLIDYPTIYKSCDLEFPEQIYQPYNFDELIGELSKDKTLEELLTYLKDSTNQAELEEIHSDYDQDDLPWLIELYYPNMLQSEKDSLVNRLKEFNLHRLLNSINN